MSMNYFNRERKNRVDALLTHLRSVPDGVEANKVAAVFGYKWGIRSGRVMEYLDQLIASGLVASDGAVVKCVE